MRLSCASVGRPVRDLRTDAEPDTTTNARRVRWVKEFGPPVVVKVGPRRRVTWPAEGPPLAGLGGRRACQEFGEVDSVCREKLLVRQDVVLVVLALDAEGDADEVR
jgi:hypothetical protein